MLNGDFSADIIFTVEKKIFDYGAFEKYKITQNSEHLENLEEVLPFETTEHLQFQDKIKRLEKIQEKRHQLQQFQIEQKRNRIKNIKLAKANLSQKENNNKKENLEEPEKIEDVIFDWEVPFMDDFIDKKTKKSQKCSKKTFKNQKKLK